MNIYKKVLPSKIIDFKYWKRRSVAAHVCLCVFFTLVIGGAILASVYTSLNEGQGDSNTVVMSIALDSLLVFLLAVALAFILVHLFKFSLFAKLEEALKTPHKTFPCLIDSKEKVWYLSPVSPRRVSRVMLELSDGSIVAAENPIAHENAIKALEGKVMTAVEVDGRYFLLCDEWDEGEVSFKPKEDAKSSWSERLEECSIAGSQLTPKLQSLKSELYGYSNRSFTFWLVISIAAFFMLAFIGFFVSAIVLFDNVLFGFFDSLIFLVLGLYALLIGWPLIREYIEFRRILKRQGRFVEGRFKQVRFVENPGNFVQRGRAQKKYWISVEVEGLGTVNLDSYILEDDVQRYRNSYITILYSDGKFFPLNRTKPIVQ